MEQDKTIVRIPYPLQKALKFSALIVFITISAILEDCRDHKVEAVLAAFEIR